jgi:hypothetical protein
MKAHIIVPFDGYDEHPPLDGVLKVARSTGWPLILVTRPENKIHIDDHSLQKEWVFAKATASWPESVLMSQPFWADANLLLLPGLDLRPDNVVIDIVNNLKKFDISYGLYESQNIKAHGHVEIGEKQIQICDGYKKHGLPWGLLAFRKSVGRMLFESMISAAADHEIKTLPFKATKTTLNNYIQS